MSPIIVTAVIAGVIAIGFWLSSITPPRKQKQKQGGGSNLRQQAGNAAKNNQDIIKVAGGFAAAAIIFWIAFPEYFLEIVKSRLLLIVLLAIVILSVSTIRRPFQKSNARKALRGFAFFAIFLAFITPLFGSEEEYNPTRVEKRILAEERKKATSSPQEYTEPINQIHYLTEKKKRADHTVIKKTETGTFVSIDGSNGYFQNPDRPLGHDTGIVVNPGETIKVGYVSGHLTYNCYGHGSRDRIWEGYNFEKAKWEAGERIRYKRPYSGHSVFVILKTDSKEKADYYKNGRREVVLTNDLSGKARVYLLYNIYKKFLSRKHMLADGFPRAACERSMMKFFIKKE